MDHNMYTRIENHGSLLKKIFPGAADDPVALCKKLRRIEARVHRAATDCCNGDMNFAAWEKFAAQELKKVRRILGDAEKRVWVNGDPRGYALKMDLRLGEHLYTDWGGYGIIAPNLS